MFVRVAFLVLLSACMVTSSLGRRWPIDCRRMECPALRCANQLPPPPGQCCPTCGPLQCYDKVNNAYYDVGSKVPRKDPCTHCTCTSSGRVECAIQDCARPNCEDPVREEGKCCPICPPRCFDKKTHTYYNVGDSVPREDSPCEHCSCNRDLQIRCVLQDCARPPCRDPVQVPGKCCPVCPPRCFDKKTLTYYNVGDSFTQEDNPCEICSCGRDLTIHCAIRDCPRPNCEDPVREEGKCCPICPTRCFDKQTQTYYNVGDSVPREDNPCEICSCGRDLTIHCAIRDCPRPNCEDPVREEGKCCPICPLRCFDKQTQAYYNIGDSVPREDNPCVGCTCSRNLQIHCDIRSCPRLTCDYGVRSVIKKGDCCPTCPLICFDKETQKPYTPGQTIPRSDPCTHCTCQENGGTSCTISSCAAPKCKDGVVATVKDGDCCPSCPQQSNCLDLLCELPLCESGRTAVVKPGECCPTCPDCTTVRCGLPICKGDIKPVILAGDCCPTCPEKPDCSAVFCLRPVCAPGVDLVVPIGQCCPICTEKPDCSTVSCLRPVCAPGVDLVVPIGQCCPICTEKPDCSTVDCLTPVCAPGVDLVVPVGQCCPICTGTPDCSKVSCLRPVCAPGVDLVVPIGQCCPTCTEKPDCSTVDCLRPVCAPGVDLVVPIGQCCPICTGTTL